MNLPEVIFGTSGLGNLYVVMPDAVKCAIVEEYVKAIKGRALPFLDTAGKYGAGLALESIGNCLRQLNVSPDEILISNKLGWLRTPLLSAEPTFEPGVWKDLKYDAIQKISYDGILECYEQGNQLLGNYKSSYVSVHDPDEYLAAATDAADADKRYKDILAAYEALHDLKNKGETEAIGVGAKDWRSIARIEKDVKLDWVMIANSWTLHDHPKELLDFMKKLQKQGTFVINSAVFNGGFLTGGEFYNYHWIDPDTTSGHELLEWRNKFYELCNAWQVAPAAACIRFGISAPGVKNIALSTTNPKRVVTNMALVDAVIPDGFWTALHDNGLITADGLEVMLSKSKEKTA